MEEDLKDLYESELKHLRTHADEFAARKPFARIASRLGLSSNAALRDPFVEWLLQGYAFIAARVRRRLEQEFPRFTQNLLSVVYPHLSAPTPSMIVADFQMRPDPALLASGALAPRETRLAMAVKGGGSTRRRRVIFATGRAARLWPVEVREARYLGDAAAVQAAGASRPAPAAISLTLAVTPPEAGVSDLGADDLALFLAEAEGVGAPLFEALTCGLARCEVARAGAGAPAIALDALGLDRAAPLAEADHRAGIDARDALLPRGPRSFDGYRLLHEFFALPSRFHFVRLSGLRAAFKGRKGATVTILALLDRAYPGLAGQIGAESFRTNCAPAVNLFRHRADDIAYSDKRAEHLIVPDRGDPTGYEAHSVLAVRGVAKDGEPMTFRPFFSVEGLGSRRPDERRFFHVSRRARARPERREERDDGLDAYLGSEAWISLVDEAARPVSPELKSLSLDLLCTNRHLPVFAMVDIGGAQKLTCELDEGWREIRVAAGPSAPRAGLPDGRRLWDVISHLSLNHLALIGEGSDGPETAAAALRQLLRLYAPEREVEALRLVDALRRVTVTPKIRRAPAPTGPRADRSAPMAFVRGLEIALTFDDDAREAAALGAVLDRVLAGMAEANSFTELVILRRDGRERARFAPRAGTRRLL